jgi:hypothetical protein
MSGLHERPARLTTQGASMMTIDDLGGSSLRVHPVIEPLTPDEWREAALSVFEDSDD